MNISITKGDISEVNKLIKLRKLASDVSLLHNCLPVIDMKNDDGTYAMQHRENKLKELDADRNSVLKAQKKDRPSINIARIRSLKKMTEGVLNINTKLNAKKLSLIILKLTNAINLAHKDISPKARANPDFHFSAQEAHITRISEIVEEIMDDFIAAHVDNTNGLLKIVSYTNLVCRIIEETVMQNANSTKDE
ncbi:hypothetical protein KA013_00675 [Patescibacteria group bacterium]|nr:hypothetical protein [Patescibacteria group bacterium]